MTVQVAIDLSLDRLFTYEVPQELEKKLAVGQLLSVPFGHREARGFALAIAEADAVGVDQKENPTSTPKPFKLKPITAIVDETPFFSPVLLDLVKKVAAYTVAPIESVLRAALPAAVLRKNARARELYYVEPVTEEPRSGRARSPSAPPRDASSLTARQRWLYDQIVRLGGGWMSAIVPELKTTPTALRALAAKGLVTLSVRAKRRNPLGTKRILPSKPLPLNPEQQSALDLISRETRPTLLFGITGSGKTEVYLQAIARELEAGRGAIVMVPEIALTPQTVQRFASRFGACVAVLHSALSDGERYDEWHRIRAGEARVVVGPRSAVWAPVRNLGLIVVDEEHETSYKQDETPRYNARDVAVLRGHLEGARVILGSATPSMESWANVRRGKYALAKMSHRAGSGRLPAVSIVDMGEGDGGGLIFSSDLLNAIKLRLDRHEQTILFLNRRGFSRSMACVGCGRVVECPACGLPYTYHRVDNCLRCHVCGGWIPVPTTCPACGGHAFTYKGLGTQRAEEALAKCFPRAGVLRMDADTTGRKSSHDEILTAFRNQKADILVGTQMIAKGLDFPNVTLVGVLNADASLSLAGSDFRAAERTFQLLAQVSGRAGRAELPGEVIIQTYNPGDPTIRAAARSDFESFAADELKVRESCDFPPFCHLALLSLRAKDLKFVADWTDMYAKSLAAYARKTDQTLKVSEALPSALEKADGFYRWQIVLRAPSAAVLARAGRWISSVRPPPSSLRLAIDIDAFNLV